MRAIPDAHPVQPFSGFLLTLVKRSHRSPIARSQVKHSSVVEFQSVRNRRGAARHVPASPGPAMSNVRHLRAYLPKPYSLDQPRAEPSNRPHAPPGAPKPTRSSRTCPSGPGGEPGPLELTSSRHPASLSRADRGLLLHVWPAGGRNDGKRAVGGLPGRSRRCDLLSRDPLSPADTPGAKNTILKISP